MPCDSWSIPAVKSCPGAFFGVNAICGTDKKHTSCYATRHAYVWSTTQLAQKARYDWLLRCMASADGYREFVETMVTALARKRKRYFRIHDSGDMFNARYISAWYEICSRVYWMEFWVPTRSYRLSNLLPHLVRLNSLPNVIVRPSALHFEDAPPVIEGLSAGTSAAKTEYNCPAHTQGNMCGSCRKCWDKTSEVVYRLH